MNAAEPGRARELTIRNRRGLHARAAARFVKTAAAFAAEIKVAKDGIEVSGTSIMGLMMLAAAQGATIQVSASGREAAQALEALTKLLERRFDEED
ncbi:MAG: HPr family phosphocarrier protein [Alphaproteobacteria bacterium]|nr:HPr family phosphocarrier protein [Alphaproteobacteria bacterium]